MSPKLSIKCHLYQWISTLTDVSTECRGYFFSAINYRAIFIGFSLLVRIDYRYFVQWRCLVIKYRFWVRKRCETVLSVNAEKHFHLNSVSVKHFIEHSTIYVILTRLKLPNKYTLCLLCIYGYNLPCLVHMDARWSLLPVGVLLSLYSIIFIGWPATIQNLH